MHQKQKVIRWSSLLFVGIIVGLAISCGDDEGEMSFDRLALVTNLSENIIIPSYEQFVDEALTLRQAAETFSETPTLSNLEDVQASWRSASGQWKRAEIFDFGPVRDFNLGFEIDFWPTRENLIQQALFSESEIDSTFAENQGAAARGLPAMEYLLFDQEGDNDTVLEAFTIGERAERRRAYLREITANLHFKARVLLFEWSAEGNNYLSTFIATTDTDMDAVNVLANSLIIQAELIVNQKLGRPLGTHNGGNPAPSLVEAQASESSLSHIRNNLDILEEVFLGEGNGTESLGFDDYLEALRSTQNEDDLALAITTQITSFRNALESIPAPLDESVIDQTALATQAFEEGQTLIRLLKADMLSAIGGFLLFSDNDGD